jgi:hypothetical protein
LSAALLFAGCGGGGSNSGGGVTVPTAAVQITSSNANAVVTGTSGSSQIMVASHTATAPSTVPVGLVVKSSGSIRSVLDISLAEFARSRDLVSRLPSVVTGASSSNTYQCKTAGSSTGSGTFSVNYIDAAPVGTYGAGDTLTLSYNNCMFSGTTATFNGSGTFAIGSLSTSAYSFTLTYVNYSIVDSTGSLNETINGDLTLSANNSGTVWAYSVFGTSLEMNLSYSGTTNHFKVWAPTGSITNKYDISYLDQYSAGTYDYAVNMSVATTGMGGSVSIVTQPDFTGTGTGNPTAGSMKATGANGSYVTITANADGLHADVTVFDGTNTTNSQVLWSAI